MKRKTFFKYFVFIFAVVIFVLSNAYINSPEAAVLKKVRMGSSLSPPDLESITPYVAKEKGFFEKNGLDVIITEFRGDAIHTKALLAGEVDVSYFGATSVIVSASKGAKVKLFMVSQPVTPYYLVARGDVIKEMSDVVDKNIAVSGIGAISYHIPRLVFEKFGINPDRAKYVAVGSPADRLKGMVAGKIDATVITATLVIEARKYPNIKILAEVPKILPEIPYEFMATKEEYIEKNQDAVYAFTKSMIEANRYIFDNKAGTVEVAKKYIRGLSEDILSKGYDLADKKVWGVNGDLDKKSYDYTANVLKKVGYLEEPIPYEQFFDRRFIERVLKEIGRR